MKDIADALGYEFRYKGCICEGLPLHYSKVIGGNQHKLIIYGKRGLWRLIKGTDVVLKGTQANMHTLLSQYENH